MARQCATSSPTPANPPRRRASHRPGASHCGRSSAPRTRRPPGPALPPIPAFGFEQCVAWWPPLSPLACARRPRGAAIGVRSSPSRRKSTFDPHHGPDRNQACAIKLPIRLLAVGDGSCGVATCSLKAYSGAPAISPRLSAMISQAPTARPDEPLDLHHSVGRDQFERQGGRCRTPAPGASLGNSSVAALLVDSRQASV